MNFLEFPFLMPIILFIIMTYICVKRALDEKKIFVTVLYRNLMHKADSPEFFNLIDNFRNLHSKISSEKPYFLIFTGDFNDLRTHSF